MKSKDKAARVIQFETKIKADIEAALNALDVDSKDQLLTFLQEDIEEFQKVHVDSEYNEDGWGPE